MFEHMEEKEAVKIATRIEENGYAFYKHLAKKAEDKRVRDALERLAAEESRHMKVIEDRYYPQAGFGEMITEEEIDMEEHVDLTSNPKIFTMNIDIEKLVHTIDSVKKAILLAIQAERYAAELFEGLAEKATTEEGKTMYQSLVEEEKGHAKALVALLDTL
ncbi:MAG: ferritin family protein [Thermodesulfobacteriota bacterium]